MDQEELFRRLTVSLDIGLFVERGWRTGEERDHQAANGLRSSTRSFAFEAAHQCICALHEQAMHAVAHVLNMRHRCRRIGAAYSRFLRSHSHGEKIKLIGFWPEGG
jgi:hypothetical protein